MEFRQFSSHFSVRYVWFVATMVLTSFAALTSSAEEADAIAIIHGDQDGGKISRHLYGHFAEHLGDCVYGGLWVGEDSEIPNVNGLRKDIIEALKKIQIPNLRWPGGCYADDYHWRDGIGPRSERPERVNIHWGGVVDTNAFGTHEFLDLCEMLGAEPYIAGNMGSGTPQEMRNWIEYMTYDGDTELTRLRKKNGREEPWKVKYFGVGNENWGCGGDMTPEYYADLYRRFAVFCRDFGDNKLTRVACGPGGLNNNRWTEVVAPQVGRRMQGYSLHFYTVPTPWDEKYSATGFGEDQWISILNECLRVEELLDATEKIFDSVESRDRNRGRREKIGLYVDEWGTWYKTEEGRPEWGLYQQNSLCDALVAGLTLHVFHEHCDRVHMANIAQIVNVLQSMILTKGEKMLLTPTYHVFDMYKVHHDAKRLPVDLISPKYTASEKTMPALSVSASEAEDGAVHVSIVNADANRTIPLRCELAGMNGGKVTGTILTAEKLDAHNTFEAPENVKPAGFSGAELDEGKLNVEVPPRSVIVLELTR